MVFFDFIRCLMWGYLIGKIDIKYGCDNYLSVCFFKWKCNGLVLFWVK